MSQIRVVDLSAVTCGGEISHEAYLKVGQNLAKSFEETGFVYITGHGIPQTVIDNIFKVFLDFFMLDEAEKQLSLKGPELQGWVSLEAEGLNEGNKKREIRECYDIRNISEEGIFPDDTFPKLRPSVTTTCTNLIEVAKAMQRCLSAVLGLNLEHINNMTKGLDMGQDGDTLKSFITLRSLFYPAISDEIYKNQENVMRVGEHTDFGLITLLMQDETGGPEVETAAGEWIYADYKPGCILVNVGDLLENLTGGRFKATNHRLKIPNDEQLRCKKRQSIVFFVLPDHHVPIKPVSGPEKEKYKETTCFEYSMEKLKRLNGHFYGFEDEEQKN